MPNKTSTKHPFIQDNYKICLLAQICETSLHLINRYLFTVAKTPNPPDLPG